MSCAFFGHFWREGKILRTPSEVENEGIVLAEIGLGYNLYCANLSGDSLCAVGSL